MNEARYWMNHAINAQANNPQVIQNVILLLQRLPSPPTQAIDILAFAATCDPLGNSPLTRRAFNDYVREARDLL